MTTIEDVLDLAADYFDCGVNEGRERREVDTPDGIAQKTRDKLRAAIEQYAATAVLAERDALQARLEAAEIDAERYRWLRDKGDSTWVSMAKRPGVRGPEQVDTAIDAALAIHTKPKDQQP